MAHVLKCAALLFCAASASLGSPASAQEVRDSPAEAARPPAERNDKGLPTVRSAAMERLLRRHTTWDLNFEGGFGHVFSSPTRGNAFVRGRAGVTFVRDPFYDTLGITYEYSGLSPATFGLQAEVAWLEKGFWAQAGLLYDVSSRAGLMSALGWALFGVEGEYRNAEATGNAWAIYGKIRLPVSLLVRVLADR